uniref:Uncharacterized protein n=1 Tax=Cannabis sativa TaxID=3483 RepID=A0A803QNU6_CANSA
MKGLEAKVGLAEALFRITKNQVTTYCWPGLGPEGGYLRTQGTYGREGRTQVRVKVSSSSLSPLDMAEDEAPEDGKAETKTKEVEDKKARGNESGEVVEVSSGEGEHSQKDLKE